jgi:hypothetical protein
MNDLNRGRPLRGQLLRDAAWTFFAVLLAFAALDDITTDTDTNFTVEWVALGVCAAWLSVVSWRLLRDEHQWLAVVSAVALVVAVGAGVTLRFGTAPFRGEYLATMAALMWFVGLSGILAFRALRLPRYRAA